MTSRAQLARQRELRRLQSFAWERSDGKGIIREEPDPRPGLLLFFTKLASPQTLEQKARRGAAGTIPCLSWPEAFGLLAAGL